MSVQPNRNMIKYPKIFMFCFILLSKFKQPFASPGEINETIFFSMWKDDINASFFIRRKVISCFSEEIRRDIRNTWKETIRGKDTNNTGCHVSIFIQATPSIKKKKEICSSSSGFELLLF